MKFLKYHWIIILIILFYIVYFSAYTITRYNTYNADFFDLGHMDQVVWNTTHGRIFQISDISTDKSVLRLSDHADFFLILIAPIYLIYSNPISLLVLQAFIVGLGIIPIYLYTKEHTKSEFLPYLFAVSYVLLPGVEGSNIFDFHSFTVGSTFLLFSFYFLNKKKYLLSIPFLILLLITKETVGFTVFFLSLYFIIFKNFKLNFKEKINLKNLNTLLIKLIKEKYFFIIIGVLSLIYSYIVIIDLIPLARGSSSQYIANYTIVNSTNTGYVSTLMSFIQNVFVSIPHIFQENGKFLLQLFLPIAFLSLFSGSILFIAIPELVLILLSNNPSFHMIYFHYSALINPIIMLASINGFIKLDKYLSDKFMSYKTTLLILLILICSFVSNYYWGWMPYSKFFSDPITLRYSVEDIKELDKMSQQIPIDKSVSASMTIGEHFSERYKIYLYPNCSTWCDYIILSKNDADSFKQNQDYMLFYKGVDIVVYKKNT